MHADYAETAREEDVSPGSQGVALKVGAEKTV